MKALLILSVILCVSGCAEAVPALRAAKALFSDNGETKKPKKIKPTYKDIRGPVCEKNWFGGKKCNEGWITVRTDCKDLTREEVEKLNIQPNPKCKKYE